MTVAEIAGLVLLVVLLALIAIIVLRHMILVRAGGFDVSWRLRPGPGDRGWLMGQARFRHGQLALYRAFSAWPTAALALDRTALVLGAVRDPVGAEPDLLPPASTIVTGSCRGTPLELALTEDALTALRSWVESRPPGSRMPAREHPRGPMAEPPER